MDCSTVQKKEFAWNTSFTTDTLGRTW